ncbi:Fructoselysine-6-P-deglycase FrlB with duplicated sugar isomerase (SIS) domain [Nakamurella panacisegetis]|uniref:Fructoselysine-6-P-deglycase FrlB with duplicated sugar isomerase (SIS) domain n=1 Tax=Nakamurella panacisegetis TaxID=1090615 RepID=A0A1H0JFN3_9ACTN|nr:SIS domain-containing protein [Nakamurella panacisegetis]SDO42350.1 Fructoselysine-6-P-deglycase FrlB with duplicated sugar isomerase (SIS) domain [Nakamurella panacisegetis]
MTNIPAQYVLAEIETQPQMWARAAELARTSADLLPQAGQRIAVVGCGTSWFVAQAYAALREEAGHGVTDAFAASEFPAGRRYDLIVAITRSGTTTEVLELLAALPAEQPTLGIIGDPNTPGATAATRTVLLDFADEQSVVQTRFATTALALLRAGLGQDLSSAIAEARAALTAELPAGWQDKVQFTFLGTGAAVGLANEAALKMREAALAWAESYPSYDYRHGPISLAEPHSLIWSLGTPPPGLAEQITATGASVQISPGDPMATLVHIQRLAIALALHRGLDPDSPRNLTRSIVLT